MADETIAIKVTVDGAAEATQNLSRIADGTTRLGEATKKSGAVIGELRQGIGGIGQALAALDPGISRSIGAIQGLGTSVMSSMSTLGPWGILIGTVTAGIGYMASGIADADAEAKRWTDTLRNQTIPTLEDLIAKIQEADRRRALLSQRSLNVAGPTDAIARQNRVAAQMGAALGRRAELLNGRGINDLSSDEVSQLNAINAELNQLRDQNQRALAEVREAVATERQIQQDEAENFVAEAVERGRQSRRRGGRGGGGARPDRSQGLDALMGRFGEHDDVVAGLTGDSSAIYGSGEVTSRGLVGKGTPGETIGTKGAGGGGPGKGAAELEKWNAASRTSLDALRAISEGEASLRKERLLGMGKEAAWRAAFALAEAAGMALFNPPGMAGKLAEAAQFGEIALALGAGGAALGGGGSAPSRARPDRIGGSSGGSQPVTVINNLNAPAMVTEGGLAELGRNIMVATHAAQRRAA